MRHERWRRPAPCRCDQMDCVIASLAHPMPPRHAAQARLSKHSDLELKLSLRQLVLDDELRAIAHRADAAAEPREAAEWQQGSGKGDLTSSVRISVRAYE